MRVTIKLLTESLQFIAVLMGRCATIGKKKIIIRVLSIYHGILLCVTKIGHQ